MKVAIVTILFDYPDNFKPTFENKILYDVNQEDYFVVRYNSITDNILNESYYFKFTHFRIKKLVEFVKSKILGRYDYFILLDATDVGYVGNIHNIEKIMEEYGCDILFGAERNNWPNTEYSYLYETKNIESKYRYLNAGVFCAKPKEFVRHIDKILSRQLFGLCDQGNWQIEYLLDEGIEIDYKNKLVFNTYLAKEDFTITEGNVTFKIGTPIFVHDNGGYNEETVKLLEYFK